MSAPKQIPTPQPISSPRSLQKTQSCFALDVDREQAWEQKRKTMALRRSKSLTSLTSCQLNITDHDVDELKACFELGFSFDRSKPHPKLLQTLPALHLYYEVVGKLSRSSSVFTNADDSSAADASSGSEPCTFRVSSGDDPVMAKMRLKQWAHVVACSLRDSAMNNVARAEANPDDT